MEIVKRSSNKVTIKMSKSEWLMIGKEQGWLKTAAKFEIPNSDGTVSLDFAAAEEWARTASEDELLFSIRDAKKALEAMPEGRKSGFYADEVHTYARELNNRKNRR